MKKLIVFLILLVAVSTVDAQPFAGKTKHKTVKKLKKRQVKKIAKGENLYVYKNGKLRKNL